MLIKDLLEHIIDTLCLFHILDPFTQVPYSNSSQLQNLNKLQPKIRTLKGR